MESVGHILSLEHKLKEKWLKDNLSAQFDLPKLFKKVDNIHRTSGARIVYIDSEFTFVELRPFQPGCHMQPVTLILREAPREYDAKSYSSKLRTDERESKLIGEVAGTALRCGAAVLSWVVVFGSGAAIPISGGTSAAVTYLGYAAATASTLQCINGGARTFLEVKKPETKDWLDSQEWYNSASLAIDAISVAGALASGAAVLKTVQVAKAASSKSTIEILKGLSRAERKRLTQEIIKTNHPKISSKIMKSLIRAGKYPSRFSQVQINNALSLNLKDAIGASLSFSGSAISGNVRTLAIGLYEETLEP